MSLPTTQNEVYLSPEPFTPRIEKLYVGPGSVIVNVLADACNKNLLLLDDIDRILIFVNGEQLPEDTALDYVVQIGDVVNVTMAPLGGGGRGGNKVLQTILTIAVLVIANVAGAAVGGLTGALITAAITIGGTLAINAIFKPHIDRLADANDKRALQDQSNQFRPRSNMPLVLGKRRVAFDLAARPYTQFIGEDMWLHVMFGVHYGKCQVENLKIGETLLADYPSTDIEVEYFLEPGPRDSVIYPGRVIQENLSDQLDLQTGEFEVHTTSTSPDRIEVDFTWPGGLRFNKDNGKILPQEVQLLIEWSVAGSGLWSPAPVPPAHNRLGALLPAGSAYVQARTQDPVRRTFGWETGDKTKQYDVRVKAFDPDHDDVDSSVYNTYWTALRTIEFRKPIVDETLAVIALRVKASDDISGTLPTITGVVTPIVPIWDGDNWNTEAPTSNAAALTRWLLTGPAAAEPLDPELEIHTSVVDAYELIEERNWAGSIYSIDERSQEDVLLALGRTGRFSTYWNGSKFCFVTDWEKPAARQMFTGMNASGYKYKRVFPNPIHAVFIEFVNADKDWQADEMWVYNDGFDSTNATLFETLRLDYSCTMDKAYRDGRVYLAKRKLQVEIHSWTAGADAIVSTFGDRIRVRHNATLFGLGEATVQFRRMVGGLVAGLRLNEPIFMEAGKSYSIDSRSGDFILTGLDLVTIPGYQKEVTFATPIAVESSPSKGDLVVFGEVGQVTEDLEIIDFDPQDDMSVAISAQRYVAEDIMAAETGPIPDLDSIVPNREEAPQPRVILAEGDPNGVRVTFDVNPVYRDQIAGFASRYRRSPDGDTPAGTWQVLPMLPSTVRQVITGPIPEAAVPPEDSDTDGQYRVDVEIRTVMRFDKYSKAATAYNILVSKPVAAPKNFSASPAVRVAPDNSSYPVIEVSATPVVSGEVQDMVVEYKKHADPVENYTDTGTPLSASNPFGDITGVLGGQAYDVRARFRTQGNWKSDWVVISNVLVPSGSLVSSSTNEFGGLSATEFIAQLDAALQTAEDALAAAQAAQSGPESLARAVLQNALDIFNDRKYSDQLTYVGGVPVGTLIVDEVTDRSTADTQQLETISLIGAKSLDGLSFEMNTATFKVSPTESFFDRLNLIETRFGGTSSSYLLTQVTSASSAASTAIGAINLMGAANGTNTAFVFDSTKIKVDSSGQSLAQYIQNFSVTSSQAAAIANTQITTSLGPGGAIASSISTVQTTANNAQSTASIALNAVNGNDASIAVLTQVAGRLTGFKINGATRDFILQAARLILVDDSGGSPVIPFAVLSGLAYFANPITIQAGAKKLVLGPAFGSSGDLLLWFGNTSTSIGSMSKTNGNVAFATDGKAYYNANPFDSLGGGAFEVQVTPPSAAGGRLGSGPVNTNSVTAVLNGATGSVSWTWQKVGDFDINCVAPNNATTNFSANITFGGQTIEGFFLVTGTDSGTGKSAQKLVNTLVSEFS